MNWHIASNTKWLKYDLVNFDMLATFSFEVSSNSSQQKNPTAEIIGIYFLEQSSREYTYMPIISAVGLFRYDKFKETPNEKVVNMSKLTINLTLAANSDVIYVKRRRHFFLLFTAVSHKVNFKQRTI